MDRQPVIFLGPSLSHTRARTILPDADYRPPARKGDLLLLASDPHVTLVGLVDGVFMQDYPPTPIEVYQLAKRKNSITAGAASLGALRAVELAKFGMVGIGTVFRLYNSGKINADDEVAVTFSPDYSLQSEAMIDIRYNLFRAQKRGIIGNRARTICTKIAKEIYFPNRTYDHIAKTALAADPTLADEIAAFQNFISSNRRSLKENDAIELLQYFDGVIESMAH